MHEVRTSGWSRARSALQRMLAEQAASGILLLVAAALALAWANSPWGDRYRALWQLSLGPWPLRAWIDDAVMTLFFLAVGLEIRRDLFTGDRSDLRRAGVPFIAAIGGMVVPAVVFAVLNAGRAGAVGWAIPMATDIAFAVGVLAMLGDRASPGLRVLLLSVAVIDDLGAVLVIAVFYSTGIQPLGLVVAAAALAVVLVMRRRGVRAAAWYILPGAALWAGLALANIHPTLAGVVLGLVTPVTATADETHAPADWLLHQLHPWVQLGVMPVFAFANAGVALGGAALTGDAGWLFAGIVLGLVVGKPIGIAGALAIARRPTQRVLLGAVGGIGFTMSLFIAQLAFPDGPLLETAKLGILAGSAGAALVAVVWSFVGRRSAGEDAQRVDVRDDAQ
ncbi:MAG TPA: Na+/H+ antiporter NhaA [Kofleriaceae bacterium]|nr:Na+/H+ antiporter NhaA [Kofleriaceae bacterium]